MLHSGRHCDLKAATETGAEAPANFLRSAFRRWRGGEDGVSAVEFGLFAPVLFFALLAAVDLGMALYERMTMDHVLRAGAQSAMADQGAVQVKKVLDSTAAKNFVVAASTSTDLSYTAGGNPITLDVTRFCACPENTGVEVACSTTCAGSKPTFVYYRLEGSKTYDGMIIPSIDMDAQMQVQVR